MHVTVVTVLESGQHLWFNTDQAPDSIERAADGVIADHINSRLESLGGVKRFVIVAADLSWSVNVDQGQHLLYPARSCNQLHSRVTP